MSLLPGCNVKHKKSPTEFSCQNLKLKLIQSLALTSSLLEIQNIKEKINIMRKQSDKSRIRTFHKTNGHISSNDRCYFLERGYSRIEE